MMLCLGYFDDETCRLEPIENPFGPKLLPMSPAPSDAIPPKLALNSDASEGGWRRERDSVASILLLSITYRTSESLNPRNRRESPGAGTKQVQLIGRVSCLRLGSNSETNESN